jgi:hypothetical protein
MLCQFRIVNNNDTPGAVPPESRSGGSDPGTGDKCGEFPAERIREPSPGPDGLQG